MAKSDLREWAVKGAEQRLVELADEARAIFAAFPELREQGRGFDSQLKVATGHVKRSKRRRKGCQPPPARRSASHRRNGGRNGGRSSARAAEGEKEEPNPRGSRGTGWWPNGMRGIRDPVVLRGQRRAPYPGVHDVNSRYSFGPD